MKKKNPSRKRYPKLPPVNIPHNQPKLPRTFNPDSELLDIATAISLHYKTLKPNDYFSQNDKYHVRYMKRIIENGKPRETVGRIEVATGRIDLDRTALKREGYSANFVFYLILWCKCCKENNGDFIRADRLAVRYYLKTRRSKRDLLFGYLTLFSKVDTMLNRDRIRHIKNQLIMHKK